MSFASLDEVAVLDDDGRIEGLQFDGRERRIQEWREKKEAEEFDKLIAKLRQHKNYRAWYEKRKDDPEFRRKMREHNRRMKRKHGTRRNAEDRAKRRQEAEENPIVNTCQWCGKEFTIEFGFKKKRTSKYCSRTCRNRVAYLARKEREQQTDKK